MRVGLLEGCPVGEKVGAGEGFMGIIATLMEFPGLVGVHFPRAATIEEIGVKHWSPMCFVIVTTKPLE
jgi:hypothetical protein